MAHPRLVSLFDSASRIAVAGPPALAIKPIIPVNTAPLPQPTIAFGAVNLVALEGDSGTKAFSAPVVLNRDGSILALGYSWQVEPLSPNPADAVDFGGAFPSGTGTFAPNETSKTILFMVSGDAAVEPNERFRLVVTLNGYNTISANGTIQNDDAGGTPLPTGFSARFNPASLSALGDGAQVASWTDSVGGINFAQGAGVGNPATFVADNGGFPAVKVNRGSRLEQAAGNNAITDATTANNYTLVVIGDQMEAVPDYPIIASINGRYDVMVQASNTQVGAGGVQEFYPNTESGLKVMAIGGKTVQRPDGSTQNHTLFAMAGSCFLIQDGGSIGAKQFTLGGATVYPSLGAIGLIRDVLFYPRMLTFAEIVQIQRHWCDKLARPYPGGASCKHFVGMGDSMSYAAAKGSRPDSWIDRMAARLNWPWGTWHRTPLSGHYWGDMALSQKAAIGDISAVTNTRTIIAGWEFANQPAPQTTLMRQAVDSILQLSPDNIDFVLGTSTSQRNDVAGGQRDIYNQFCANPANRTGIAGYAALHLDPNIGAIGAAPASGGNAYFDDDSLPHILVTGEALVDNGPYGMGPVIAALRAA